MEVINYKGKEIYYVDASNMTTQDLPKIEASMNKAKKMIASKPPKSALMITNVANTKFNSKMTELFKDYASHNTPYAKASALVGVGGMQKVVLTAVKAITGRDYYLTDSLSEAKEWIVNR